MQQDELSGGSVSDGSVRRAAILARSLRRTSSCAFALANAASLVSTLNFAASKTLAEIVGSNLRLPRSVDLRQPLRSENRRRHWINIAFVVPPHISN